MILVINGENREFPNELTLSELIQKLEIKTRALAVEVNGELITRSRHQEHRLSANDKIEIVTLVGGG